MTYMGIDWETIYVTAVPKRTGKVTIMPGKVVCTEVLLKLIKLLIAK